MVAGNQQKIAKSSLDVINYSFSCIIHLAQNYSKHDFKTQTIVRAIIYARYAQVRSRKSAVVIYE